MRMNRAEFGWLVLAGVVLLLGVWWIPGGGTVSTDTYSVAHSGKKAIFRVLQALGTEARRGTNQLVPDSSFGKGTLLILGPARYPTASEWFEILQHVSAGANLVFAARSDDPIVRIDTLGLRVVMPDEEKPFDVRHHEDSEENANSKDTSKKAERFVFNSENIIAKTELVEGTVHWSGVGFLKVTDGVWKTLVEAAGQPRVMSRQYGLGHVVVASSDRLFSNQELLNAPTALLAYRLISFNGDQSPIIVDETLNRTGVPKVFGILFDPELRPLTLQFLLAVVLFGWCGSRRFGPALPPTDPPRRSIVEHAIALGGLYYRTRSTGVAISRWLQFFRQEFHLSSQDKVARNESEMLARWAGLDSAEVSKLMESVTQTMQEPKSSTALAAKQIRALAELRLRIMSRLRRSKNAT